METSVFQFNDPVEFLNAVFQQKQAKNPQLSLRAWTQQLGLPHVSMLSMVLNRKRKLLPTLSSKITQYLIAAHRFTENEARYFDILVLFSHAKSQDEKLFYKKILSSLRPDQKFSDVSLDHFRVISDWYHLAILEMTLLKDFDSDPRWICLRLGGSVNEGQVNAAIDRLMRVGLLEKAADGRLKKKVSHYATSTDVPNAAIRSFHAQMIRKALLALESQRIEDRDISAHIVTISKAKLPEAKQMIRDFRRKIADFLETPEGDAVYQINVQLFDALGDSSHVHH